MRPHATECILLVKVGTLLQFTVWAWLLRISIAIALESIMQKFVIDTHTVLQFN